MDGDKLLQLRKLWGEGHLSAEIARRMGYSKLPRNGVNVIVGEVSRQRNAAKARGDMVEAAFWTRKKNAPRVKGEGIRWGKNLKSSAFDKSNALPGDTVRKLIDGVDVPKVRWPTDEEVAADARRQISEAADKRK